ncbi:hypothetical protein HDE_08363 [Halotydeus destructor]|nr:hypothetical protein HDE_08363 [Halotydeus destructor]
MTNRDFAGTTYYTIRNVSLYECLGWCREEADCSAAVFSFVVNPLAPLQETTCRLQNETQSVKNGVSPTVGPANKPSKAVNLYYFSKSVLSAEDICKEQRVYDYPKLGLSLNKVAHFVELNYYPDKELLVKSQGGCLRACTIENEFICRSVLFRPTFKPGQPNCALYHLDHKTYPDGMDTFATPSPLPLFDSGETSAIYLESSCANETSVPANSQQTVAASNGKPSVIAASTQSPLASVTQPVRDDAAQQDPSCDSYGVCYEVTLKCTDTKILVNVKTSKPFHGRIYALGRSETCNAHIRNSQQFNLDMSLSGQDCNTQSVGGVYTNTVVLQHHNVVLTKADKVYHVRCTYETTSRNVSFGMMPVRDPETLQITSSPEAPLPKIHIYGMDGKEASTVRIGDKLTFRIQIPESTPYGIFARSCVAMAKDARSVFEIIDEHGCPVDNSIFPSFAEIGNALESAYEAFRFTESYGVIFQCNVKYCIGRCEPVVCGVGRENIESWGRRKRSVGSASASSTSATSSPNVHTYETDDEMTLSREILVLDFSDPADASKSTMDQLDIEESERKTRFENYAERCSSRSTVVALSIISALLVVMYVCTVAYFTAHRRTMPGMVKNNPMSFR